MEISFANKRVIVTGAGKEYNTMSSILAIGHSQLKYVHKFVHEFGTGVTTFPYSGCSIQDIPEEALYATEFHSVVCLLLGANNLSSERPFESAVHYRRLLLNTLERSSCEVIILGVLPRNINLFLSYTAQSISRERLDFLNGRAQVLNCHLKELCNEYQRAHFVEMWEPFSGPDGGRRDLLSQDGLHLQKKGIGRALCKKLVKCGAKVIAISRTKETLDSLVLETPGIEAICLDLGADWNKTRSVIESIGTVDCLVNNAAVAICTPFLDVPPEEFDILFNVNVKAILNVSQVVAKGMIKQGRGGSIVNISSQAAQAALKDHVVYCGTKGALDIMSKVMALELGSHNIRVNCVNPTVVMTDMGRIGWSDPKKAAGMLSRIPLNRFAEVDEVVNSILFLLSDAATIINGITLPVDGGFLAC